MTSIPPEPSWRKPVGILGLLAYLALYALAVSAFADSLSALPAPLMFIAYLAAGLAWVFPLKPLFLWMNTGHWSSPKAPK
jgi:hypothetical protein